MFRIILEYYLRRHFDRLKNEYDLLSPIEKESYYINAFYEDIRDKIETDGKLRRFCSRVFPVSGWEWDGITLEVNRYKTWKFYICAPCDLQDPDIAESVTSSDSFKKLVFSVFYIKENIELSRSLASYSPETRLTMVQMYYDGMPLKEIQREFGIDRKQIREWIRRFERYGEEGLKRRTYANLSYEMRCEAVRRFLENENNYGELVDEYNVSRSQLIKWVTKVRMGGYDSLRTHRRGRPPRQSLPN